MRTKLEPDDEFFIPEIDFSKTESRPNPFARKPGEKTEIHIDGAIGYALRLIPSNKTLARFDSTLEAWPEIIRTIEAGRSPRTLSLDCVSADGRARSISAGPRLERWARFNNGDSTPYSNRAAVNPRRVAEAGDLLDRTP
jgi:hypothetical protein